MARVDDRRFETGDWPIRFVVPEGEQAATWLQYLNAECRRRDWSNGGLAQLDARENSGSITINAGAGGRQLAVVWERKRAGPIDVRARSYGASEFPVAAAQLFFDDVNVRCQSGATERVYVAGHLTYEGLPWLGEVWLDDTLQLAPPSQQYEAALLGPRVVLVHALVDCISPSDVGFSFKRKLQELAAFLSVVMGTAVSPPEQGQTWTWTTIESGAIDCAVRNLGYVEMNHPRQMPPRGAVRVVPLRPVNRPDFSERGIDGSTNEQQLPADITDLWTLYRALTPDRRQHFLQVAAKWQEAMQHWAERSTLSMALLVVACEALKPADLQFKDHDLYHVIEALLGQQIVDALRRQEDSLRPQEVRNAHLHRGVFGRSEFVEAAIWSSFQDPTFDQARRELTRITQAAIIEWLRRGGTVTLAPPVERKTTFRRWLKQRSLFILPIALAVGTGLGWFIRAFFYG